MKNELSKNNLQQLTTVLHCVILVVIILYFGKTLFIPLSFSFLIGFILFPICRWMEQKGVNRGLAVAVPTTTVFLVLGGMGYMLINQLLDFSYNWGNIKEKTTAIVQTLSYYIADKLGLSAERQLEILQNLVDNAGNKVFNLLGSTVSSFSDGFYFLIMIPIFSSLILFYRHKLVNALYGLFPAENRKAIYEVLTETIHTYYNFIKGMALVYLLVGILNSIGLALIGIPHPIFFGSIAAVLTFIPYVGIMIASLLPITVAWATYNDIWYPIAVILVFAVVQFLEAYLIFPFAVGKNLKINTLTVFVMIVLGGMLWGAAGMILFIPMVSILKLIADKSPNLKYLSELLGE